MLWEATKCMNFSCASAKLAIVAFQVTNQAETKVAWFDEALNVDLAPAAEDPEAEAALAEFLAGLPPELAQAALAEVRAAAGRRWGAQGGGRSSTPGPAEAEP